MKIMLVEDNETIILGLEYLLSREGYQVVTAKDRKQALAGLEQGGLDLVVLDIALPDGSGFDVCREVREQGHTPVIFLTAMDEERYVVKGLDMGADDYIVKPFRNRELVSRIRSVLRRNGKGSTVLRCGEISLDTETGLVRKGDKNIVLTKLEYKILSVMMQYPGRLFTRDEILANIWDISGSFVNDNTLSVTMKRIREKIEDTDGSIIRTVRGMGYRLEAERQ
ncbi:MAG: response regulator transcription factor [Lachnospiraceae bacterium]|nr:response regulator transcription factor [Lachnospiraceae bacterium]